MKIGANLNLSHSIIFLRKSARVFIKYYQLKHLSWTVQTEEQNLMKDIRFFSILFPVSLRYTKPSRFLPIRLLLCRVYFGKNDLMFPNISSEVFAWCFFACETVNLVYFVGLPLGRHKTLTLLDRSIQAETRGDVRFDKPAFRCFWGWFSSWERFQGSHTSVAVSGFTERNENDDKNFSVHFKRFFLFAWKLRDWCWDTTFEFLYPQRGLIILRGADHQ